MARNGNSGGMGSMLRRLISGGPPTLGCEISPGGITVGRWNHGASYLTNAAWRPLPPNALDPTPLRQNIAQPDQVRAVLAGCLDSLGLGSLRAAATEKHIESALVIPDQSARLFVLDFDSLPRGTSEAVELVRWRLKKSVPFDIDASALSFTAHRRGSGWQVISVVTPNNIVQQYEDMLGSLGLQVSRITLSSLATMALIPQETVGSTLLVKMNAPWITTAIVYGDDLALFRTAELSGTADGGDSAAAILETIYPAFAYFQDTFGRQLDRVYVCGLGESTLQVTETISTEMHAPAQPLLAGADVGAATSAGWTPFEAERYSAALTGLLRE